MTAVSEKVTAEQAKQNVINATKELEDKILGEIYEAIENASKKALSQLNFVISGKDATVPNLVDEIVTTLQNDQYTVEKDTKESRVLMVIKWPADE